MQAFYNNHRYLNIYICVCKHIFPSHVYKLKNEQNINFDLGFPFLVADSISVFITKVSLFILNFKASVREVRSIELTFYLFIFNFLIKFA